MSSLSTIAFLLAVIAVFTDALTAGLAGVGGFLIYFALEKGDDVDHEGSPSWTDISCLAVMPGSLDLGVISDTILSHSPPLATMAITIASIVLLTITLFSLTKLMGNSMDYNSTSTLGRMVNVLSVLIDRLMGSSYATTLRYAHKGRGLTDAILIHNERVAYRSASASLEQGLLTITSVLALGIGLTLMTGFTAGAAVSAAMIPGAADLGCTEDADDARTAKLGAFTFRRLGMEEALSHVDRELGEDEDVSFLVPRQEMTFSFGYRSLSADVTVRFSCKGTVIPSRSGVVVSYAGQDHAITQTPVRRVLNELRGDFFVTAGERTTAREEGVMWAEEVAKAIYHALMHRSQERPVKEVTFVPPKDVRTGEAKSGWGEQLLVEPILSKTTTEKIARIIGCEAGEVDAGDTFHSNTFGHGRVHSVDGDFCKIKRALYVREYTGRAPRRPMCEEMNAQSVMLSEGVRKLKDMYHELALLKVTDYFESQGHTIIGTKPETWFFAPTQDNEYAHVLNRLGVIGKNRRDSEYYITENPGVLNRVGVVLGSTGFVEAGISLPEELLPAALDGTLSVKPGTPFMQGRMRDIRIEDAEFQKGMVRSNSTKMLEDGTIAIEDSGMADERQLGLEPTAGTKVFASTMDGSRGQSCNNNAQAAAFSSADGGESYYTHWSQRIKSAGIELFLGERALAYHEAGMPLSELMLKSDPDEIAWKQPVDAAARSLVAGLGYYTDADGEKQPMLEDDEVMLGLLDVRQIEAARGEELEIGDPVRCLRDPALTDGNSVADYRFAGVWHTLDVDGGSTPEPRGIAVSAWSELYAAQAGDFDGDSMLAMDEEDSQMGGLYRLTDAQQEEVKALKQQIVIGSTSDKKSGSGQKFRANFVKKSAAKATSGWAQKIGPIVTLTMKLHSRGALTPELRIKATALAQGAISSMKKIVNEKLMRELYNELTDELKAYGGHETPCVHSLIQSIKKAGSEDAREDAWDALLSAEIPHMSAAAEARLGYVLAVRQRMEELELLRRESSEEEEAEDIKQIQARAEILLDESTGDMTTALEQREVIRSLGRKAGSLFGDYADVREDDPAYQARLDGDEDVSYGAQTQQAKERFDMFVEAFRASIQRGEFDSLAVISEVKPWLWTKLLQPEQIAQVGTSRETLVVKMARKSRPNNTTTTLRSLLDRDVDLGRGVGAERALTLLDEYGEDAAVVITHTKKLGEELWGVRASLVSEGEELLEASSEEAEAITADSFFAVS